MHVVLVFLDEYRAAIFESGNISLIINLFPSLIQDGNPELRMTLRH